jgi:archaellum component FlaF (FlaF/FlaG flagellin family)
MRAVTLISAILFIAITISVVAIVYQSGMPLIERMQQTAALGRMSEAFSEIDSLVRVVAHEGNSSRRVFDLRVSMGRFAIDAANDLILWQLSTKNTIIPPRTAEFFGNLIVGSNLGSSASEGDYQGTPAYVLENEHLRVYLRRIGSPESHQDYDTADVLLAVYQKDSDQWLPLEALEISVDDDPSSSSGSGYTLLERSGDILPYGRVNAYMDSAWGKYYINITLESGADFLQIEAEL